eukprot:8857805-Pyramimonas_sp.AAC.1
MVVVVVVRRRRRKRRRRRTSVNLRVITDVDIHTPSKMSLHRYLQGIISTEGLAPPRGNRVNIFKRANTPFSGFQRQELTCLLRLGERDSCQNAVPRMSAPRINVHVAPSQS